MAHATATDVYARWGKNPDAQDEALTTLIDTRLGDVERMIIRRFKGVTPTPRDLEAELTLGSLDLADLIQVEADAVLRLAKNPEGYTSETDGDYVYQLSSALANGQLEILPTEWFVLGFLNAGMFIIAPTPVLAK